VNVLAMVLAQTQHSLQVNIESPAGESTALYTSDKKTRIAAGFFNAQSTITQLILASSSPLA
jgi:hypothetical protein